MFVHASKGILTEILAIQNPPKAIALASKSFSWLKRIINISLYIAGLDKEEEKDMENKEEDEEDEK